MSKAGKAGLQAADEAAASQPPFLLFLSSLAMNLMNEKSASPGGVPVATAWLALTPYQATFYREWLLNPQRSDYNMVLDQRLWGELNLERLNQSLIRLVNDYLLINSNVVQAEEALYWQRRPLLPATAVLVTYHPESLAPQELLNLVRQPFDLEQDLLFRVQVLQEAEGNHRLVYLMPHILIDGLSYDTIISEFSHYYNDASYTTALHVEQQVALHQQLSAKLATLLAEHQPQMQAFWDQHLLGVAGVDLTFLKASLDPVASTSSTSLPDSLQQHRFSIGEEELEKLKQLTRKHRLTPYIYGQLVFGIALHRLTGQEVIGLSYPVGILEGKELLYGAHVNTVLVDYRFGATTTLSEVIQSTLAYFTDLKASKAKYLPVADIVQRVADRGVLEVAFIQTNLRSASLAYEGIEYVKIEEELEIDVTGKLLFEQELRQGKLEYRVRYDAQQLDGELVGKFIDLYQRLFTHILQDILNNKVDKLVQEYSLLTPSEYQQVVYGWNATEKSYPREQTIQALFEAQVEKTPDNIAVVYGQQRLTYRALNEQANRLAHYLRQQYAIRPDDLIALCLDRSEQQVVGILAVLKAGGAYVPIDPAYPADRIKYILQDTQAKALITNESNQERLQSLVAALTGGVNHSEPTSAKVDQPARIGLACIDSKPLTTLLLDHAVSNPNTSTLATQLAYVIYTSGTTGQPKGVMIEHRGVVNLIADLTSRYGFGSNEVLAQLANYVFDASVEQILLALLNGHTLLVLAKDSWAQQELFISTLADHKVTHLDMTPSLIQQVTVALPSAPAPLRRLISGGEALSVDLLEKLNEGHYNVINSYGPTETTVTAIVNLNSQVPIIGRPLANTSAYVLDAHLMPLPVGAVGELYLGGDGVARGYLNRPELTQERFLANPFQSEQQRQAGRNGRIYKTGDLVRYLADGNLEYLGRNDDQLKVRGYRIELGEIESQLAACPGIQQAAVLAKEKAGQKYLVGYYVAEKALDPGPLRAALGRQLPAYMVPAALVHLDKLPLSINGKLDRRALSEVDFATSDGYVAPSKEVETLLADILQEVLEVKKVGVRDNFFELGLSSLLSIKVVAKVNCQVNRLITIKDLFVFPTIEKLAQLIEEPLKLEVSEDEYIDGEQESEAKIDYSTITTLPQYSSIPTAILITGATGFVGAYLLKELLDNTTATIYCLIRAEDLEAGKVRILKNLNYYHLREEAYESRLTSLLGDVSKPMLGLSQATYEMLSKEVDYVYHLAAYLDSRASYQQLKPANVNSNVEIVKFALSVKLKKIVYASTLSVFSNQTEDNRYEKDSITHEKHSYAQGYAGSKWVGEKIMLKALEKGLPIHIHRLGLIGGDNASGKMPKEQWFSKLLQSCYELGVYPEGFKVAVTPVDFVAKAMCKLSLKGDLENSIFHLSNPNNLPLETFIQTAKGLKKTVAKVSIRDWLKKLKDSGPLPISSLIDFETSQIKEVMEGKAEFSIEQRAPFSTDLSLAILKEVGVEFPTANGYYSNYLPSSIEE